MDSDIYQRRIIIGSASGALNTAILAGIADRRHTVVAYRLQNAGGVDVTVHFEDDLANQISQDWFFKPTGSACIDAHGKDDYEFVTGIARGINLVRSVDSLVFFTVKYLDELG